MSHGIAGRRRQKLFYYNQRIQRQSGKCLRACSSQFIYTCLASSSSCDATETNGPALCFVEYPAKHHPSFMGADHWLLRCGRNFTTMQNSHGQRTCCLPARPPLIIPAVFFRLSYSCLSEMTLSRLLCQDSCEEWRLHRLTRKSHPPAILSARADLSCMVSRAVCPSCRPKYCTSHGLSFGAIPGPVSNPIRSGSAYHSARLWLIFEFRTLLLSHDGRAGALKTCCRLRASDNMHTRVFRAPVARRTNRRTKSSQI